MLEVVQALLICVEMLAASLAHRAVFSYKVRKTPSWPRSWANFSLL